VHDGTQRVKPFRRPQGFIDSVRRGRVGPTRDRCSALGANADDQGLGTSMVVVVTDHNFMGDSEFIEILPPRCHHCPRRRRHYLRPGGSLTAQAGQKIGSALHRCPLHEMCESAQTRQLLTAAGPAGTAVNGVRNRGAVAGALRRIAGVEHQEPTVPWGRADHGAMRNLVVGGDDRRHQAAFA
jgi:hypothetical protein